MLLEDVKTAYTELLRAIAAIQRLQQNLEAANALNAERLAAYDACERLLSAFGVEVPDDAREHAQTLIARGRLVAGPEFLPGRPVATDISVADAVERHTSAAGGQGSAGGHGQDYTGAQPAEPEAAVADGGEQQVKAPEGPPPRLADGSI
eukprot:scaffold15.g4339.t1